MALSGATLSLISRSFKILVFLAIVIWVYFWQFMATKLAFIGRGILLDRSKYKLSTKLSKAQISERVSELGAQIAEDYDETPILVGVLQGAFIFLADLARAIESPVELDFIGAQSYVGQESTGEVKLTYDMKSDITNRHIILVEDIVDTGRTLTCLVEQLQRRGPKSIKICSLLFKPDACEVENMQIDYLGFSIPTEFVVGYGLDLDGAFRELPYLAKVET